LDFAGGDALVRMMFEDRDEDLERISIRSHFLDSLYGCMDVYVSTDIFIYI
jgi:hypothetical protein